MPKRHRQRQLVLRASDRITVRLKRDYVIPTGTELEIGPIQITYDEPTYEARLAFATEHPGYFTVDEEVARAHPELFEVVETERADALS